jgi:hypothetical protein
MDADVLIRIESLAQTAANGVTVLRETLEGRKPTPLEPSPPPGLVAKVDAHGKILANLIPNGGNTDNPGDLLLKIAQRQGVTEADRP